MATLGPVIYLAGPDVFHPDAVARLAARRALCQAAALDAITPLDPFDAPPEWDHLPAWQRIALANEARIANAVAIIADLSPFRGASADAGTVFELGLGRALGLLLYGYTDATAPYAERVLGRPVAQGAPCADTQGLMVENDGLADNLMIEAAIIGAGGVLLRGPDAFARCVAQAARDLVSGA